MKGSKTSKVDKTIIDFATLLVVFEYQLYKTVVKNPYMKDQKDLLFVHKEDNLQMQLSEKKRT